jgi:hypothetical protein
MDKADVDLYNQARELIYVFMRTLREKPKQEPLTFIISPTFQDIATAVYDSGKYTVELYIT